MKAVSATLLVIATFGLSGCGRTLVFAERDAVDIRIAASASRSPPLEVNFGIDRHVGAIVPPSQDPAAAGGGERGRQDRTIGQAVNMFSGFRVAYVPAKAPAVFGGSQIRTQFASGAAATAIAESPNVVNAVVDVSRTRNFPPLGPADQLKLRDVSARYFALSPERKSRLAEAWGCLRTGATFTSDDLAECWFERVRQLDPAKSPAQLKELDDAITRVSSGNGR